jgi:hypothetical protein
MTPPCGNIIAVPVHRIKDFPGAARKAKVGIAFPLDAETFTLPFATWFGSPCTRAATESPRTSSTTKASLLTVDVLQIAVAATLAAAWARVVARFERLPLDVFC